MSGGERPNVLVVYGLLQHPLRATIRDHLYSFRRYARSRCFYLNLGVRRVPGWLRRIPFDAVIYHHTMTGQRMLPPVLSMQVRRARALHGIAPRSFAMIQDECIYTDSMSEFIEEFEVDDVFSVAPPSQWRTIYPTVDHQRVRFHQLLPGYLDEQTVDRIDGIVAAQGARPLEIGYRAWAGLPSLGSHGMLRVRLADAFAPAAAARGMRTDISTSPDDTFHGDDWFRFLARCKYVIGAEGGATILDPKGELKLRAERFLADHPGASFAEIEAACFPGEDGKLALYAISPRHIEACATRTCQVLVEGEYSGVLRPGEHYIELRRDLSNIEQVLDLMQADELRAELTEAAYRDVVASGAYTYRSMVE
ncbi:MAG: hypothetical protein FJW90_12850, partial [Actinobacteria bacterium]|nr:hypothetical protein [Actinomycetota bacterium]